MWFQISSSMWVHIKMFMRAKFPLSQKHSNQFVIIVCLFRCICSTQCIPCKCGPYATLLFWFQGKAQMKFGKYGLWLTDNANLLYKWNIPRLYNKVLLCLAYVHSLSCLIWNSLFILFWILIVYRVWQNNKWMIEKENWSFKAQVSSQWSILLSLTYFY